MRLVKVLKYVWIVGLLIVLLVTFQIKIPGMSLKSKGIILLSKYRALFPYIVAQAKVETGNFTSNVFLKNKNYFGMKLPKVRPTLAQPGLMSPEGNNYAAYGSESDSVVDLLMWFDYTKFPIAVESVEEYSKELKNRAYYGVAESSYTKNLKYWLT